MFGKKDQYNAYNMATQTVPKIRQVVMLYDGAIRFAMQAKRAMEEGRIEDRYKLLTKVSDILMGLQGALDFDNGGEIAPLLYDYYSSLDARILYIQRKNDLKMIQSIIDELKKMRGAWGTVDSRSLQEEYDSAPEVITPQPSRKAQAQLSDSNTSLASTVQSPPTPEIDRSIFVSA